MRISAWIIGVILLVFGIAGFIPHLVKNTHLFDVFRVNMWLNIFHLVSGVLAIFSTFTRTIIMKLYFQIFGILYAILAILGFIYKEETIFGYLSSNTPDTWFHVVIAIPCLILGYGSRDKTKVKKS